MGFLSGKAPTDVDRHAHGHCIPHRASSLGAAAGALGALGILALGRLAPGGVAGAGRLPPLSARPVRMQSVIW